MTHRARLTTAAPTAGLALPAGALAFADRSAIAVLREAAASPR